MRTSNVKVGGWFHELYVLLKTQLIPQNQSFLNSLGKLNLQSRATT